MFKFLDIFFLIFHSSLIIFNVFGWVWKRTRKINLITLILTGGSWFILGIFYGWGYCFLTDWHWNVLYRMGEINLPNSYIQYLMHRLTGLSVSAELADCVTVIVYAGALIFSLIYNFNK